MAAPRDGRIGAMVGGATRSVGHDAADLRVLERRRQQAEKLQRKAPVRAFAELLDEGAAGAAEAADTASTSADGGTPGPGRGPRPRGRGRLIRG